MNHMPEETTPEIKSGFSQNTRNNRDCFWMKRPLLFQFRKRNNILYEEHPLKNSTMQTQRYTPLKIQMLTQYTLHKYSPSNVEVCNTHLWYCFGYRR